ncbi:hypothetical protein ANOM_007788 [Aspergillus nomiae NRRL 13137]|uniref:Uncharacterized protein n=1 Tax=Aspergillus nomiae NRRL (strain ATCC 15546 / NRRL 13137 / CBS 260.88 / M93) TaxID=1509407 RepID=A0A0L1IWS7_ASPN3|nr:uncharacterized protein ANOM_007788 [Aspergillus nomiae NRRL 13137]KNG84006.1 hypothetical protein ANOM_007788 [Aspergillus nomiae NRRL 13137]
MGSTKNTPNFYCDVCRETFRRQEHLDRHLRRHLGVRPFTCSFCSKSFSRRDTLQRHISTHGDQQNQPLPSAKRPRSNQACQNCAREKQRCSGYLPCVRCTNKNRTCVFEHHSQGGDGTRDKSSTVHVLSQDGIGQADMSFGGDIRKLRPLPGDPQLVEYASAEAPPEIRPFSTLSIPNYVTDLGNLFTWGPFDCLHDPQYSASLNNGTGLNGLDTLCQQSPLPFEPPPVLQSPRPGTPIEPATLQSLPTPTEEIHRSSQSASLVLNDPIASSSTSPRGDPDSSSDYDILIAENFFHVRAVRKETYEKIQSFYLAQTDICFKRLALPDLNRLNCLVQLYFEYFHSQMPFIHPVMFESDSSWILVLAVAAIGSQYTKMAKGKQYIIVLSELLRRAIPLDAVKALQYDAMTLAQSTLLLNVSLVFNGFRDNIINLQFLRTWLATLIRPFLNPHSKRDSALLDLSRTVTISDRWHAWLQVEARTRLVYGFFRALISCSWTQWQINGLLVDLVLDSFCVIFIDMQPSYSMDDFEHRLPSPDELWNSQDAHSWESHLQSCPEIPIITLREFLSSNCSSSFSIEQLSRFNRLTLLLGLFVGEKQAVNISRFTTRFLVPNGNPRMLRSSQETPNSYPSLNSRYQLLEPNFTPTTSASAFPDCFTICYHLTSIFRYTSLRDILAYTGWLVTNVESIAAGKRIAQVMEKDTEGARKCVIHAGAIIRETRGVLTPACYQGFSLLFAFLYLWVYERFCTSTTTKWPRSDQSSPHRLLRIDRGPDPALEKQWIAGNPDCRPYLTGVGLLLEPGASTRLLRECQRILKSYDAWPHLRAGFILALNELVEEVNPLTDAPYSWAS